MLDLRLVTTFRTVARLGTISAAAAELLVSQPALSRQIQQLERAVGLTLFRRIGRKLELTAAGHEFLVATDGLISAVDGIMSLAGSLSSGRVTRVRMAAPATTLSDVLAPFLASLEPTHPLITVVEASYAQAVDAIGTHVDLAVLTAPPHRGLGTLLVAELPVWAYVPDGHPLAAGGEITLETLAEHQLIVLEPSARPRRLLDDAFIAAGLAHNELIECAHPRVAQALAASGRGVAVVSDDPRFSLQPLPISTPWGRLTISLHAAWDQQHHASGELAELAGWLRQFCADRYQSPAFKPTA